MKCITCGEETTNPKFCSKSCAAKYNNVHFPKRKLSIRRICKNCGVELGWRKKKQRCCSHHCHEELKYKNKPFSSWPKHRIRKHLLSTKGTVCERCDFSKTTEQGTGPFQIHHIDGNKRNNEYSNLEVLCNNCHWFTGNWGFRNKTHTHETRKRISKKLSAYYSGIV